MPVAEKRYAWELLGDAPEGQRVVSTIFPDLSLNPTEVFAAT